MQRRSFLVLGGGAVIGVAASLRGGVAMAGFEITRTDAEWRAKLNATEYKVMRKAGTERAGSSPLDKNYTTGQFICRGCDLPLYESKHKFDSGTGWPSFWQAKSGAVETKPDRSIWGPQTEVHCRRCGSHLGHIFDDGPKPTGKRHCINGVSLVFRAA